MASSFLSQIPGIIYLISKLKPKTVLDIGKGFGKYGFLIHEYVGIDNTKKINNTRTLKELSNVAIDAVEVDDDLLLPHLSAIYRDVINGDITKIYPELNGYDLVLMIDIIEHIHKQDAIKVVSHFLNNGADLIVATPKKFFEQTLYESDYENHVSHWTKADFKALGLVDYQYYEAGAVYFLSKRNQRISGFGNTSWQKLKRIARAIKNEL